MIPGEYIIRDEDIIANAGRDTVTVRVTNTGDRPIQVGSHTHFFEVNKALEFPRDQAYGYHLNIPSGTSVRFEPGDTKKVELTEFGGSRTVFGFSGLVNGDLEQNREQAFKRAVEEKFGGMNP